MKARDLMPPVFAQLGAAIRRSLASDFRRGTDADDALASGPQRLAQPYAQSALVHAAINHITGELAGLPVKFYAGETEFTDPAFVEFWKAPALGPRTVNGAIRTRLPIADVIRDLAAWTKLEGEFFLLFDDSWLLATAGRSATALSPWIIANPSRTALILQGGALAGYRYTDAHGRQSTWLPEQVVHWKAFNPYDDFRGLGSLQAATVAAEAAYHTGTYIRELMRNNGDQGFIIAAKHGVTDQAQREQIIADLRTKRAALRRGVPRDLFVDTDITVDRPKQDAASADLNATKTLSHEEIFIAFAVPPSMAQAKANFSMGKDSDRYQLITGTCQPIGRAICGALAWPAERLAGRAITVELDWDDHPVLVEVRNGRIDTALKLWSAGMPLEKANAFLGLGMKPFPGWERGYLPFSVQPVDAPEPAAKVDPALAEPADDVPSDDAVASLRAMVLARMRCARVESKAKAPAEPPADPFAAFECAACHPTEVSHRTEVPAEHRTAWEAQMTKRRPTMKAFKSAFGRVLMQARAEVLQKIESSPSSKSSVSRSAAIDFLFDLGKFSVSLRSAMDRAHHAALQAAGEQLFSELDKDDPFTYPPAEAVRFIRERQNKLAGVPDEIHARIKTTLEAGLNDGDTMEQLAKRIRSEFNDIDEGRARVIASTETAAAYGTSRDQAMRSAGVQWKAWLTSGNSNVRAAHYEAGLTYSFDTPIPVDEPFIVGGERLMHPGDQAGSPANTINCHCVQIAVAGPAADSPVAAAVAAPAVAPVPEPKPIHVEITLNQPGLPPRKVRHVHDGQGRIVESIAEDVVPPAPTP
jgi:hypothetical protein